ncbi:MAG: DNA-binding response regulator, partial [Candidatus Methylumidiphilus alinenensis]
KALDRSPNTISTLRKRILDKMDMKNNSELAHYAINNQLI